MVATVPHDHTLAEDFKNNLQSDTYDFLRYLLIDEFESAETVLDVWKIQQLFNISVESEWTCDDCGQTTIHPDAAAETGHGLGISVNILEPRRHLVSLTYYLRNNTFREQFNARCTSAQCLQPHGEDAPSQLRSKQRYITEAPEVLIIRIIRYARVETKSKGWVNKKLKDIVRYDEYLNLGEFTRSSEPLLYKLQGVVAHRGSTLEAGHYISAVRQPDGMNFRTISDDHVVSRRRQLGNGNIWELQEPAWTSDEEEGELLQVREPEWEEKDLEYLDPCMLFYSKL